MKIFDTKIAALAFGLSMLSPGMGTAGDNPLGGLLGGLTGPNGVIGSNVSNPRNNLDVQREIDYLNRDAQAETDYLNRDAQAEIDYENDAVQREIDYYDSFNH